MAITTITAMMGSNTVVTVKTPNAGCTLDHLHLSHQLKPNSFGVNQHKNRQRLIVRLLWTDKTEIASRGKRPEGKSAAAGVAREHSR